MRNDLESAKACPDISSLTITLISAAGGRLGAISKEAIILAITYYVKVDFVHNDTLYTVDPGELLDLVRRE